MVFPSLILFFFYFSLTSKLWDLISANNTTIIILVYKSNNFSLCLLQADVASFKSSSFPKLKLFKFILGKLKNCGTGVLFYLYTFLALGLALRRKVSASKALNGLFFLLCRAIPFSAVFIKRKVWLLALKRKTQWVPRSYSGHLF